jgi:signal peptide peptidase SppA
MRYLHILSAFVAEPWAMQREKLAAVAAFLAFKARGGDYTAEEVQAKIDGRRVAAIARAPGDIAVIPLVGVISQRMSMMQDISGGVSTDEVSSLFQAAVQDDGVKAIVLDIDSPGGSTYGVQELASQIYAARGQKPVIAQVNSLCASAAYWIACQADEIVVTPGGDAGSLGVYAIHEDITQMLEQEGVKPTIIRGTAGQNKAELSGLEPLTDDARQALQTRVDEAEAAFINNVAKGRGLSAGVVRDRFGQGRVFGAAELVERGMADKIGTFSETVARLGGQQLRGTAGAQMRQAFAAGETPALKLFEDHLRDGGVPVALATAFVSLGKGALRQSDSGEETNTKALEAARRLRAQLDGFSLPQL